MIKAAAVLAKVLELIATIPPEELEWFKRSMRQYLYLSGSKPGSMNRFTNQVHEPGSNGHFEQEVLVRFFLQFWSFYPRKQGKQDALRIYRKLQVNQELQDRILRAILEQKASEQWTKENGQFIPLPKTWLNRGSWDDEPVVQTPVEPRFGRTKAGVFKRFTDGGSPQGSLNP